MPVPADRLASRGPGVITPNQRKLLDMLALEVNRDGVSVRDLGDVCGLSTGAVHRALSNLMRKDWLHKPGTQLRRLRRRAGRAAPDREAGSSPRVPELFRPVVFRLFQTPFLAHVPAVPALDVMFGGTQARKQLEQWNQRNKPRWP